MSIVETITKAEFKVTDAQVEALARDVVQGKNADGTYLRVLVAACKVELAARKRVRQPTVIDRVHARFYPHVQKGVGGEDVPTKERNRRATFARTAASTLRTFVSRGGNMRTLEPVEVTKIKLVSFGREVPTGTRIERAFERSTDAVLRLAIKLGRTDPVDARRRLMKTLAALQDVVDAMAKDRPAVRMAAATSRRRPSAEARAH